VNADPVQTIADPLTPLVKRYEGDVFRFLRSMVGNEDTARDLTQETFLKLKSHAHDAGRALVYKVARSCALDHFRRRSVRSRYESPATEEVLDRQPAPVRESPDRQARQGVPPRMERTFVS